MNRDNNNFFIISGPCSFESEEQINEYFLRFPEASHLRAGIFKMRTKKDNFQGLRAEGISPMVHLKQQRPFELVSEVVSEESVDLLSDVCSIFQIGARNMYNYDLIRYASTKGKPLLLKRSFSATIDEWVSAA